MADVDVRIEIDRTIEQQLEVQPEMHETMSNRARLVEKAVESVAPKHTGDYARSIFSRGDIVGTKDPFGHLVEWGSVNNHPYAPLRRGVRAAGLRLVEEPKAGR